MCTTNSYAWNVEGLWRIYREREREREREWFGQKLCKTVGIGNSRLSSRIFFLVFLRSLTEPKIRANARHYQIHLFHACTSASNQPSHSLLLMECLPFSPFFSDNNSAINRFKRDSSLRPGDSHPFDVGLGRAPPVDLPRICSYALAVEKGIHPDAVAPRRPGLRGGAESEPHFARAFPPQEQHPWRRCPGAAISNGIGWWSCGKKGKRVGDVLGPCVLVPSWWDMCDYVSVIETFWTLLQLETFALHGLVTSYGRSFCTSCRAPGQNYLTSSLSKTCTK